MSTRREKMRKRDKVVCKKVDKAESEYLSYQHVPHTHTGSCTIGQELTKGVQHLTGVAEHQAQLKSISISV